MFVEKRAEELHPGVDHAGKLQKPERMAGGSRIDDHGGIRFHIEELQNLQERHHFVEPWELQIEQS
jgi:hypothetical protein